MGRRTVRLALLLAGAALAGSAGPEPAPPAITSAQICHAPPPGAESPPATLAAWADGAILFDGLGDRTRRVATASLDGQRYFDQGMRWLWAFNHDEATRGFARAATLDPGCAMCFWGAALTVGPNYNMLGIGDARGAVARAALRQALALAPGAAPVEQALVEALAKRYPDGAPPDLAAYAAAMRDVAARFPDDMDVRTLAAEALMTANAWNLWTADGQPAPGTPEILGMLEDVLARDPTHPGANHYYVHAVEASPDPGRGVAAAERLRGMMPAAGHLEHMPSHIFQRVGRYEDSAEANRRGAAADLAYFKRTRSPDYYEGYTVHNFRFLSFAASMEGRSEEAVRAARDARGAVSERLLAEDPWLDWSMGVVYAAQVRFGLWRDVLAEPPPDPARRGLNVAWLWARGTAFAALGQLADAADALAKLDALAEAGRPNPVHRLHALLLRARIAREAGDLPTAAGLLGEAVRTEDVLGYREPPDWYVPARQTLGALLLRAEQPEEAADVYRADLDRNVENGWSLLGLSQALAAQGRTEEAKAARARFEKAWTRADVMPPASAF